MGEHLVAYAAGRMKMAVRSEKKLIGLPPQGRTRKSVAVSSAVHSVSSTVMING
jgi:hypothetical protein